MIELIPAIDISEGFCVRLTQGQYSNKKIYNSNPVEVAMKFERMGLRRIHIVDLDGAKGSHIKNLEVLRKISTSTNLIIDFGGGIKSKEQLELAFDNGASLISIGSIAATNSETVVSWAKEYGSERFIICADQLDGKIRINGWQTDTGMLLKDFIEFYSKCHINNILCTDIRKDGMLDGPNISLYQKLTLTFPTCNFIASGGISCKEDLHQLQRLGVQSVIIGKAFYEGIMDFIE